MKENREESAKFECYYLFGSIHMNLVNKRPFLLLLTVELSLIIIVAILASVGSKVRRLV